MIDRIIRGKTNSASADMTRLFQLSATSLSLSLSHSLSHSLSLTHSHSHTHTLSLYLIKFIIWVRDHSLSLRVHHTLCLALIRSLSHSLTVSMSHSLYLINDKQTLIIMEPQDMNQSEFYCLLIPFSMAVIKT